MISLTPKAIATQLRSDDKAKITWEEAVLWLRDQPDQPDQQVLVNACFYDDPLLAAAKRYHRSTEWQAVQELLLLLVAKHSI